MKATKSVILKIQMAVKLSCKNEHFAEKKSYILNISI